jgi:hypothetical protein
MDLRSTIGAVARLPFSGDKLLAILQGSEQEAATDPNDGDHTTFWFVVADQFQKKGIVCEHVTDKALELMDAGADAATMASLGMTASDLRKRAAKVNELRERLQKGATIARSGVLKKPQSFVMDLGDILVYPSGRGQPRNPYDAKNILNWTQDAWAAIVPVDRGLAFGYLTWYTIAVVKEEIDERPTLEVLMQSQWTKRRSGTCSAPHF